MKQKLSNISFYIVLVALAAMCLAFIWKAEILAIGSGFTIAGAITVNAVVNNLDLFRLILGMKNKEIKL